MRAVVFCICLLGYVSLPVAEAAKVRKEWDDDDFKMEPAQKTGIPYKLPTYIHGDDAAAVTKQKQWFNFDNVGPLPEEAKAVMLPVAPVVPAKVMHPDPLVEALCHLDRIYVRIRRNAFNDTRAWRRLYFGTCRVNFARGPHYYFLYPLTNCGLEPQVTNDSIVVSSSVRYVRQVADLTIARNQSQSLYVPVSCTYPRFHRTYDVGIYPIGVRNHSILLPYGGPVTIILMGENWTKWIPGTYFKLGQAMHFEIRAATGQRVFANHCWFTASGRPNATVSFTPIKNYGCMVDSMNSSLSRYHSHRDPGYLRFTIESFVFPSLPVEQELSLHCEVTVGTSVTPYRKACAYDWTTNRWYELDRRYDDMCRCCKGTCPDPPRTANPTTKIATDSFVNWDTSRETLEEITAEIEEDDDIESKFDGPIPDGWRTPEDSLD